VSLTGAHPSEGCEATPRSRTSLKRKRLPLTHRVSSDPNAQRGARYARAMPALTGTLLTVSAAGTLELIETA